MKHDALGRRKRHFRTSTKRDLVIGPRDAEIFRLLQRYRYLRASHIWELLPDGLRGRSEKRFRERLGSLFHERYLARPPQQTANLNFYYAESIYALDENGASFLADHGLDTPYSHLSSRARAGAHKQFVHSMMIVDTVVSIELGTRANPELRFLTWQDVLAKMPASTVQQSNPLKLPRVSVSYAIPGSGKLLRDDVAVIPDAVFAIEYPQGFILYLIEAEHKDCASRTTLRANSFLRKALAYQELRRQRLFERHFGTNSVIVLIVAPSLSRVLCLLDVVKDVSGGAGSPMFAFRAVQPFGQTPEAIRKPQGNGDSRWIRPNKSPLSITNRGTDVPILNAG